MNNQNVILYKENKKFFKAAFIFKKLALSKGNSLLMRWIRNLKNYQKFSGEKYGDILRYILTKYNLHKNDSKYTIIYMFRGSDLTFPWSESKEGYDYWNDFFNEFEDIIIKTKL